MNMKLRKATLAAVTASALILTGCASDGGSDSSKDSSNSASGEKLDVKLNGSYNPKDRSELKEGGELRLALSLIHI